MNTNKGTKLENQIVVEIKLAHRDRRFPLKVLQDIPFTPRRFSKYCESIASKKQYQIIDMLDKLNDKEINFTLLFVIVSAFYINFYKPLQMDELSTYFHCSEKSLGELINANNSG